MIIELFGRGGPVFWLIVASGLVALIVFLERFLHLHRARIRVDVFLKGIAVDEAGRSEIAGMERRLVVIATVAQTAPLFGLLGTVLAMIRAALVMSRQAPLVQSQDIITWLLQALVTTAAGLMVAIPCFIGYSFLVTRIEKIVLDMERAASEILAFLTGERSVIE